MPYFSDIYYGFSSWHSRHSIMHHREISKLFKNNIELFQMAYVYDDILFTHAGVDNEWLNGVVGCDSLDINVICDELNKLTNGKRNLNKLFHITAKRGGWSKYGSCIWADVHDIMWSNSQVKDKKFLDIKQIFGHTLQGHYDANRNVIFDDAIEFDNCKMLDTANAYELDTETFIITKL